MLESDWSSAFSKYVAELLDPSVTWRDIAWLRSLSSLPLVLKGIMTAEDATLAVENGVSGIVVSNYGGRQLDSTLGTPDALPDIVAAVHARAEVYMDGGIRRGRMSSKFWSSELGPFSWVDRSYGASLWEARTVYEPPCNTCEPSSSSRWPWPAGRTYLRSIVV